MSLLSTHSLAELASLGILSKRRQDLVVFAGRGQGKLLDNVKYAYLHAATHDCGFESYFLTMHQAEYDILTAKGLPVIMLNAYGLKILTSAGMLVMDDLPRDLPQPYALALGAVKMQLWHGIPLKKIGFPEIESAVNMPPAKASELAASYAGTDIVASTSPWVTRELFAKVFRAGAFMEHGYPRNDILLREPTSYDFLNVDTRTYATVRRHKKAGGRVVVYMPTFRDTGLDFTDEQGAAVLDPRALVRFAEQHNTLFILKLHPYVSDSHFPAIPGTLRYPSEQDIYPLLPLADVLVTDYSSVFFDYLLIDKPLIFFAYDKDRYIKQDRELFFAYDSMTPGPVCTTQAGLFECLTALEKSGCDAFADERHALRDRLFTHCDALASERVCGHIKTLLRSGKPRSSHQEGSCML